MTRLPRILTEAEAELHGKKYYPGEENKPRAKELSEMAAVNSNYYHCNTCGFHHLYPDTPQWIRDRAKRLDWISTSICTTPHTQRKE